jgi:hypothetical protein
MDNQRPLGPLGFMVLVKKNQKDLTTLTLEFEPFSDVEGLLPKGPSLLTSLHC